VKEGEPASTLKPGIIGPAELADDVTWGRECVVGGPEGPTVVESLCTIGDFVRLDGGVHLRSRCRIGDFVRVGHPPKASTTGRDLSATAERVRDLLIAPASADLGEGSLVRSHTIIYNHVRLGPRLSTGHHVLIREHTVAGARCVFGSFSGCDGYTVIGDDVQIGQGAYLAQSARIGNGVFLGGHTVLSDNRHAIRNVDHDLLGPIIEDYVRIGLNCTILPGVRIGRDAFVGASSVVTADVPPGVLAFGTPCMVVRDLTPVEVESYRLSVLQSAGEAIE
jgi:acetyltransferase-like isoleucine patch superfamily enzyme